MSSFNKKLDDFQRFADQFRLVYDQNEKKFDEKLRLEKKRIEDLIETNRNLTEKLEETSEARLETEKKYSANVTKFNELVGKFEKSQEENKTKQNRIDDLMKIAQILRNDLKDVQNENERLKTLATTSDETKKLIEKAVAENLALRQLVETRDEEIRQLREKVETIEREDPQIVEERLVRQINQLKSDFRFLYDRQTKFFAEKIDRLKDEQRENIANLYKN